MEKEIISVLAMGQSNMAGRGILGEVPPIENPNCFMLRMGRWQRLSDPVNVDRGVVTGAFRSGVGPMSGFADEMEKLTSKQIGMIPCADGGTKIHQWLPGEVLFDHALMQAELARRTSTIGGIIWHQGESDARVTNPEEYGLKLIYVLSEFRRRLGVENKPLVLGEISEHIAPSWNIRPENIMAINCQIRKCEDALPLCKVVEVQDLEIQEDGVHFSASAQRILGKRYAKCFYALLKNEIERGKDG